MKHLCMIIMLACCTLIMLSSTQAQTLSVEPVYHFGEYGGGKMEPGLDWSVSLSVPLTHKITISPSVYYYWARYRDFSPVITDFEQYLYLGVEFSYTFSSEPIFK